MVIMASGIAHGCVRTMTMIVATELHNMAAILQKRLTQTKPCFTVYFFDIGLSCYDQLAPVKTGYSLTSITWPYRGLKFTAHQGHMFFEVDGLPVAGLPIGSQAHVRLTC